MIRVKCQDDAVLPAKGHATDSGFDVTIIGIAKQVSPTVTKCVQTSQRILKFIHCQIILQDFWTCRYAHWMLGKLKRCNCSP